MGSFPISKKGPEYERQLCSELSLWWTTGAHDDCFWRTSGSGARATVRGRKGKKTKGHCGDIAATDSEGEPLIKFFTIELKRGYSKHTIGELLDKSERTAVQEYERWFEQAIKSHKHAGSRSWLLIHKRDYREPLVFMPWTSTNVMDWAPFKDGGYLWACVSCTLNKEPFRIVAMPLTAFYKAVRPEVIRGLIVQKD